MSEERRPHLLVVDDEESIRTPLTVFFTKRGFQVTAVDGVCSAQRALDQYRFDIAVLDIMLADGDGLDLLGEIKEKYPELPVILNTGLGFDEELLQRAQKLGARGFVSKTLPLNQVWMEVRHALVTPRN